MLRLAVLLVSLADICAAYAPAVISFDIAKHTNLLEAPIEKRDADFYSNLKNEKNHYSFNITLGTPGQELSLLLDTASSDMWVMSSTNIECKSNSDTGSIDCSDVLTFSYKSSSSISIDQTTPLNISYSNGDFVYGYFAHDVSHFGGVKLNDTVFGLALDTNSTVPVFGIGLQSDETTMELSTPVSYRNIPVQLLKEGHIKRNAYSIYLNSIGDSTGEIVFGGLDSNKYSGTLTTLPLVPKAGGYSTIKQFRIDCTKIAWQLQNGALSTLATGHQSALLDTGMEVTQVPAVIFDALMTSLQVEYSSSAQEYVVPCSAINNAGYLIFYFHSGQVKVPFSELLTPAYSTTNGTALEYPQGGAMCQLLVEKSSTDDLVLGDSFLRSAYVVYDLDGLSVSIAQANWNSNSQHIQEISSGDIPGASKDSRASADQSMSMTGLAGSTVSVSLPLVYSSQAVTVSLAEAAAGPIQNIHKVSSTLSLVCLLVYNFI